MPGSKRRSLPCYPAYVPVERKHTLGWWADGNLYLLDGTIVRLSSYEDARAYITTNRLDVLIFDILAWPWFPDAVLDDQASVNAGGNDELRTLSARSITWQLGKDHGGLYYAENPEEDARALAELCATHPELGCFGSAAAFGGALMASLVKGRHGVSGMFAQGDLRAGLVAGRNVWFGVTARDVVSQVDRNSAYVSECLNPLPVGTTQSLPVGTGMEELPGFFAWYGLCRITIRRKLRLGPFPVRAGREIFYPTEPGTYEAWIWNLECNQALGVGCKIEFIRGWGWRRGEAVLAAWAREIERLKDVLGGRAAELLKTSALAAIGKHAMRGVKRQIVTTTDQGCVLVYKGNATPYAVEESPDSYPNQMLHWASYIWMRARVRLYQQIITEWDAGNTVYCANTDALVTENVGKVEIRRGLGGWKVQTLHTFILLANGTYLCEEKMILPGQSGGPRTALEEAYLIWVRSHSKERKWRSLSDLSAAFSQGWPERKRKETTLHS